MAFLFKNKKNQDRGLSSRDGPPGAGASISPAARVAREDKGSLQRSTPTGSLNSLEIDGSVGSPDQFARRKTDSGDQAAQPSPQQLPATSQPSDLPFRNTNGASQAPLNNPNNSLYPWSQRRLNYTTSHPSPFPRYGAAVNSVSSKEGDVYVMGGLINSSTVKGDLWMIEAGGNMACYPLATTAEGPGPRVGHASLLVGNAFIVYGGDTKIEESDVLDETLYLLNTSTRQWSRALPAGLRPSGRYGHSMNILGSKIFIFGGQVEGYFMNDLAAYDLNQLQMSNNRWEMLQQNTDASNAEQHAKAPPARTNHSIVTFNDKMYLFGGTNGFQWFNDVWCYDPTPNSWSQLDCIGYIPVPREGHAAALVDDVMYIFGGRTEEGADLGDLAAFRITSRRWYTFQNMGPSPSPRSGHSTTTVGKSIVVVGGEPSSAANAVNDLALVYVLDTTKIRYPNDSQSTSSLKNTTTARRPSDTQARVLSSRDGTTGPPDAKRLVGAPGPAGNVQAVNGISNGVKSTATSAPSASKPPPGPLQSQPVMVAKPTQPSGKTGSRSGPAEASERGGAVENLALAGKTQPAVAQSGETNGARAVVQSAPRSGSRQADATATDARFKSSKPARGQDSGDSTSEPSLKQMNNRQPSPPPAKQNNNAVSRRASNRTSQTVALLKELDSARNRIAWYASELELARKSGYTSNATMSPVLDRTAESFDDEDKPLIEALIAMRTELANIQSSVDKQAVLAAKQIAEVERQRDAAIHEAVYAKAKLAARTGSVGSSSGLQFDSDKDADDRMGAMGRRLASALNAQRDLQNLVERLKDEVEAERRARKLGDDTVNAAHKRMVDLETYKQQNSAEVERLKAELHEAQREAREKSIQAAEAVAASQALELEKREVEARHNELQGNSKDQSSTLVSLRAAVVTSTETKRSLERQLESERSQREMVEAKLAKLKAEHEARTAELVAAQQRLRDAEELAEKHANEAQTHREVVLSGLDRISARDASAASKTESDRIIALQGQLNASNALVRKYQQQADSAAEKLRSAEERIAGLEAYQEQASREGVTIRRQLQGYMREAQTLQAANSDLRHQLESHQLEANAIAVQHSTLKDILNERGISPTASGRTRSMNSPREGSPELLRVRDLEGQLASAIASKEKMKNSAAKAAEEADVAYRDKLGQLENDYQSAVHYVKGLEKSLKQLKEQLSKYKTDNARLVDQIGELEQRTPTGDASGNADTMAEWETQRRDLVAKVDQLKAETKSSVTDLEKQLQTVRQELLKAQKARETAVHDVEAVHKRLDSTKKDLEQLKQENALLERRALDAEAKVGTLLDQVELSVDNYRRQSRVLPSSGSDAAPAAVPNGLSHGRQESSETGSLYGISDARNSTALDNLANELDMLRSHWESTNKNYRLSNAFEFDGHVPVPPRKDERASPGLSESLADWRKRLDETHPEAGKK